jgi:DNA-directed RNA polymerase specialized sigma24 family protein
MRPQLQLRGNRAAEARRVLLRTDVHLRSRVRVPGIVRLCGAASAAEATEEPRDICGCPMTLLASLRPEYAEILRRVDVEDQSLAESAAGLRISTNNAAVRLHRARKALREALLQFCGTDSMRACVDCGCDA